MWLQPMEPLCPPRWGLTSSFRGATMAKQGLFGGGSSLPGVKILTTPVKGSFHVDIPGQPSTCLGTITALGEQRCIMASSLVTNSLIIPCYDMDKSLLNSRVMPCRGKAAAPCRLASTDNLIVSQQLQDRLQRSLHNNKLFF